MVIPLALLVRTADVGIRRYRTQTCVGLFIFCTEKIVSTLWFFSAVPWEGKDIRVQVKYISVDIFQHTDL